MHTYLNSDFRRLTASMQSMLDSFQQHTDAHLNTPMDTGKWSAAQTTWHVIRALEVSLNYVEYKLSQPHRFGRAGVGSWIRGKLLVGILNSERKFKASSATAEVPEYMSRESLVDYTTAQTRRLQKILDAFPPHLHSRTVFKHPFAGRLTIRQMLASMHAHTQHHKKQTDRFLSGQP